MKRAFYILFSTILFTNNLFSQDFWEVVSTDFENISTALILGDGSMYIGGSTEDTAGLFYSSNGGETWQYLELAGSQWRCYYITNINDYTYAYLENRLYRKGNSDQWTEIVDFFQVITLFHGGDGLIFNGHWEGVDISTDAGITWENVYQTHPNEEVNEFTKTPANNLFFGTITNDINAIPGVYRSTDNGDTWNRVGLELNQITSIGSDSFGNIYAGSMGVEYTAIGGIYKSQDEGLT